jgi:nucleotide-binding universal stress UspA family protein
MNPINKILFPTDFSQTSDNALRYAMWLAHKLDASIHILHVLLPGTEAIDAPGAVAAFIAEQAKTAKVMLQLQVDRVTTHVNVAHQYEVLPDLTSEVSVGSVVWQITESVKEKDIDLVVMGTQGEHSLIDRLLGSVASAVIRKSPCPVLVVPPQVQQEHLKIMTYATDLTGIEPFQIWETRNILSPFDPELKMLHICTPDEDPNSRKLNELRQFFAENELVHPITFCTLEAEKSKIASTINQFVTDQKSDLLVLFRPDRGLLENLLHHSITKEVVLSSEVPVLVLK